MLVYKYLRKSALIPDDPGVDAVYFVVFYHENSEAKERKKEHASNPTYSKRI